MDSLQLKPPLRSNSHTLKLRKFNCNMKKNLFMLRMVLQQVAQGGGGVSFSGDIKNPPGCIPVSPGLGDPALVGGLD